jgi:hypothetical protein
MLEKCSNPYCDSPFDYRKGRLIRFCPTDTKSPGQSLESLDEALRSVGDAGIPSIWIRSDVPSGRAGSALPR